MRTILIVSLAALATACRTSSLGNCSADTDCSTSAMCDAVQRVCIPTDAPLIANVAVTTPAAYTATDGKLFFDTAGPPLSVSATVTSRGGAAVNADSVCLKIAGETGACAHPGAPATGDSFNFALPRAPGPADGTAIGFQISASGASGHSSLSPVQQVYFDDQPPSISVVDDPKAYARTLPDGGAAAINVSVNIADSSGVVAPQLISGSKSIPPTSSSGGIYVFQLDPADAPAGVEGAYGFQVSARDNLGHTGLAGGSRKIDDAPPAVSVQIYKDVPDGGGVTYPAAVANTGWTGATFVYTDTVHVSGTITDLSGVGSASLRVDGIELDGGVSAGTSHPLSCTPGSTTCPFSLDIPLNDAGSVFHSTASTFDAGQFVGAIPAANLQFRIDAQDSAAAFDGTLVPKSATSTTPARTTRLLWYRALPGAAVSGMAVHPNGDVIATMDGGTADTVYSLAPDQPVTHWAVTLNNSLAADGVVGGPAIGTGDATTARIYVAGQNGDLYAINPDGGPAWAANTAVQPLVVSPAVTQVTIASTLVDQIVLPDGVAGGNSSLWRATSATDVSFVASDDRDFHAAPLILNGEVFFASQNRTTTAPTTTRLTKHSIAANGALGAAVNDNVNVAPVPYFGLITDGTDLYAATRPASGGGLLRKVTTSFTELWSTTLTSGLAGEPTIGIDGPLYGADLGNILNTFTRNNATRATFATLGSVGMTPLQGSDGHLYVPRRANALDAYAGTQLSWTLRPAGTILRYATMDCRGRLFVGSGTTVYALISDDLGMADTAWPSFRRDARNTGNASTNWTKYGMRTASGCIQ